MIRAGKVSQASQEDYDGLYTYTYLDRDIVLLTRACEIQIQIDLAFVDHHDHHIITRLDVVLSQLVFCQTNNHNIKQKQKHQQQPQPQDEEGSVMHDRRDGDNETTRLRVS